MKDNSQVIPEYPQYLGVEEGESALFYCNSGLGEVSWYYRNFISSPIGTKDLLIISPAFSNNSGLYYCYGTYPNRSHFIATANLKVYGKQK